MRKAPPARRSDGFTLIELMIAVAIIGTLASAAIPAYLRYIQEARNVEGVHNIQHIAEATVGVYSATGHVPQGDWNDTAEAQSIALGGQPWDTKSGWGFGPDASFLCSNGGVAPKWVMDIYFRAWNPWTVWNKLFFQPDLKETRFEYNFSALSTFSTKYVWGYIQARRPINCASGKYVTYRIDFVRDADGALRKKGPRFTQDP